MSSPCWYIIVPVRIKMLSKLSMKLMFNMNRMLILSPMTLLFSIVIKDWFPTFQRIVLRNFDN